MLRLPLTTISLTMTEVKDYERRRRFRNYLAKENTISSLPIRLKSQNAGQNSHESEHGGQGQTRQRATPDPVNAPKSNEDMRLLSCPPRRPPRPRESVESIDPSKATSSQSRASSSTAGLQLAENQSQPISLPAPFSLDRRVISDVQSLPSGHSSIQPETSQERIAPEPPATPIRQSSITGSTQPISGDIHQLSRTGARIFNSAARFVESIVRFPRQNSPAPSPRSTSAQSNQQPTRAGSGLSVDGSGFSVYDDAVPAFLQPQTPQNLPEARHRSRLSGYLTEPARSRFRRQTAQQLAADQDVTLGVDGSADLMTPGFQGLYSGTENIDDSLLYHEGRQSDSEEYEEAPEG